MKIRRYIGKDAQEAILKVKMDLGSNAVILSTKKVLKKGMFGFLRKRQVEVLAAIDDPPQAPAQPVVQPVVQPIVQPLVQPIINQNEMLHNSSNIKKENTYIKENYELANLVPNSRVLEYDRTIKDEVNDNMYSKFKNVKKYSDREIINEDRDIINEIRRGKFENEKDKKLYELESKVSNMESLMEKIYETVSQNSNSKIKNSVEKVDIEVKNKEQPLKVLEMMYNNLVKNEIEIDIAKKIIDKVKEKIGVDTSFSEASDTILTILKSMLGSAKTISLKQDGTPLVVLFVGPTGVGKTTTLAKIAANFSLNNKKKVGLITADTYRIAAVEQLKTYAEILSIPVNVVYSANEIRNAILEYKDKDLILIDTAGRSFNNKSQFEELKALVSATMADEIYLVLSATTSVRSTREIIKHYNFLNDYKLIFTKLDETSMTGMLLNVRCLTKKNLSYVTTGQCVPDDIEIANINKITNNMLGSMS